MVHSRLDSLHVFIDVGYSEGEKRKRSTSHKELTKEEYVPVKHIICTFKTYTDKNLPVINIQKLCSCKKYTHNNSTSIFEKNNLNCPKVFLSTLYCDFIFVVHL